MYEELIENLRVHNEDYGQGRNQNFFKVCLDCKKAADAIEALQAQLAQVTEERDAAMKDIPHKCWSCANGFTSDTGFDCHEAHYRGGCPDCLSWRWRGLPDEPLW